MINYAALGRIIKNLITLKNLLEERDQDKLGKTTLNWIQTQKCGYKLFKSSGFSQIY